MTKITYNINEYFIYNTYAESLRSYKKGEAGIPASIAAKSVVANELELMFGTDIIEVDNPLTDTDEVRFFFKKLPDGIADVMRDITIQNKGKVKFTFFSTTAIGEEHAGHTQFVFKTENREDIATIINTMERGGTLVITNANKNSFEDFNIVTNKEIIINNKVVKSLSIGGKQFEKLEIDGHEYSFIKNTIVSKDEVNAHIASHITWIDTIKAETDYLAKISGKEYTEAESTSGIAHEVLTEYKKETISSDFSDSYERQIEEMRTPYVKHISGSATDLAKWTKISFPNLETCTRNINSSNTLTDVTLPEKFNTDAQKNAMFGSSNVSKITFHWIDANGNIKIDKTVATIDTTAQLNGLDVTYSKSTGIIDGEKITVTVKAPTNGDELNGGTTDVIFTDVVVANPARTVTQDDVESYVNSNIRWSGSPSMAHIDFTKWTEFGTKLSSPDTSWGEGDYTFTVTALPGFTINGGASVDYTISVVKLSNWYAGDSDGNIYKNGEPTGQKYGTNIYDLVVDKDKNIWTNSNGNIMKNGVSTGWNAHPDYYCGLSIDKDGNAYWIMSQDDSGPIMKNGKVIYHLGTYAVCLALDKDGNVYYGGNNKAIMKNGVKIGDSYNDGDIHRISIDSNNNIYVGLYGGESIYKNGTKIFKIGTVVSSMVANDSEVWAGTEYNPYYVTNGTKNYSSNSSVDGLTLSNKGEVYYTGYSKIYKDGVEIPSKGWRAAIVLASDAGEGSKSGNW